MNRIDDIDDELRRMCAAMARAGVGLKPCDPGEWKPWRLAYRARRMPEGGTWLDQMRVRRAGMRERAGMELQYWCRLAMWRIRRWV